MLRRVLLVADAVLLGVALLLGIRLYQTALAGVRPAAPPGAAVAEAPAPAPAPVPAAPAPPALAAYTVVAERNLFSPTRSETPSEPPRPAAATTPPAPRPRLHGVVLLPDGRSRAYLEDVQRRKVFAYSVGDAVSGSRVDQIRPDRVVLRRGGEVFEVLLRDPSKPRVAATAPGSPVTPPRPGRPAAGVAAPPPVPPALPSVLPAAPPTPPPASGDAATDESETQ